MALYLPTNNPAGLLAAFKKAVHDGRVVTWSCKPSGDFVHAPTQWKDKAVMRPSIVAGVLQFGIVGRAGVITWPVFSVYHGRLSEAFLSHFTSRLKTATATAQPVRGLDQITK